MLNVLSSFVVINRIGSSLVMACDCSPCRGPTLNKIFQIPEKIGIDGVGRMPAGAGLAIHGRPCPCGASGWPRADAQSHGLPAVADRAASGHRQTDGPDAARRSGASAPDPLPTPALAGSRPSSETPRGADIAERLVRHEFGRSSLCAQQSRLDERPF
jgi:hypothetical protein